MAEMSKRIKERKKVQDFFEVKRKGLHVRGIFDFSYENKMKRRFLAEMNALARDFEHKAIGLADSGKEVKLEHELEEAFGKLKRSFLSELGRDDKIQGAINKDLIREIESL